MRLLVSVLALVLCASVTTACANKGKLKSPSQIAYEEQKKARKAQKEAEENAQSEDDLPDDAATPTQPEAKQ